MRMDVGMMMRYGLLKGAGATTNVIDSSTNAATIATSTTPVAARSATGGPMTMDTNMLRRYGMLKGFTLLGTPPQGEPPKPQVVRFTFGTNVIYDGLIDPKDVMAWSGLREKEGVVQFALNGRKLFEGPMPAFGPRMMVGFSFSETNALGVVLTPLYQPLGAQPPGEPPKPQAVRFTFGTNVIYEGMIGRDDVMTWSGLRGKEGVLQFALNGRKLFRGPMEAFPPSIKISFRGSGTTALEEVVYLAAYEASMI